MLKICLAIAILINVFAPCHSLAQGWIWAKNIVSNDQTTPGCIVTDPSGNVIVAGESYLAKYSSSGSSLWIKDATSGLNATIFSVCTDGSGNIYVAGFFTYPSITLGSYTLTNAGNDDIFLAKYDMSGNVIWAKGYGGTGYDEAYGISIDAVGNVYMAGNFTSASIMFGSTSLTSTGTSMFIVKSDPSGNIIWAKEQANGTDICHASCIKTDNQANLLVAGVFSGSTITFGSTTLTNPGGIYPDMFVAKYDSSGNVLWANGTSTDYYAGCWKIAIDRSGNSYIVGDFVGNSIDFGSVSLTNSANGSEDIFVVSYNTAGSLRWVKQAGGIGDDEALTVSSDNAGSIYIAGAFSSQAFNIGATTLTLDTPTYWNLFIAKYDTSGNEKWAITDGSITSDEIADITATGDGVIYATGNFSTSTLTLGSNNLTNSSSFDNEQFVAKFNETGLLLPAVQVDQNIWVYPNPASSQLFITSPVIIKTLKIVDMDGRTVYESACNSASITVNISGLANGIYCAIANDIDEIKFEKK
jgi:hypothetical protein